MNHLHHLLVLMVAVLAGAVDEIHKKPMYRYRYQQADVMKTAETTVPVGGYQVAEGYYPDAEPYPEASLGYINTAGFGGYYPGGFVGGIGPGGIGGIGAGGVGIGVGGAGIGVGGAGIGAGGAGIGAGGAGIGAGGAGIGRFGVGGVGIGHHIYPGIIGGPGYVGGIGGYGGEVLDKKAFVDEGKKAGGVTYEKAGGEAGSQFKEGQGGYNKGKAYVNNAKSDAGFEKLNAGQKKAVEDEKAYYGDQAFNQEGKNLGEKTTKTGHKKGHKIKGFKTTHHKDEHGKTEEFYDEEHDEGSDYFHKGEKGTFGENAGASFKGGHDNGVFNSGEKAHQSNYKQEELLHKDKAEEGGYGENKYAGNQKAYGINNGLDHHSLHELQEGNKVYKHYPYHVPFHSGVGK